MKKSDVRARKITKGFTYPLSDSSSETERLIQQSALINPFTRALFHGSGNCAKHERARCWQWGG